MSSLPEEIYLDILLRVPVKSLLRCKCVCKYWFSLISDTDFVRMHLDRTTAERNSYTLMVKSKKAYRLYPSYDSDVAVELETPYKYLTYPSTKLLGSCNGLVYGWTDQNYFFFLWNPATREFKKLPRSGACGHQSYHGFGYDYKTDNYKLVSVHTQPKSIEVYSLKSNSWKSLQSLQYEFNWKLNQQTGVLFNGALHWLVDNGRIAQTFSTVIISMDITEERFKEVQLPMTLPPTKYYKCMGIFEECLCVLIQGRETFEVWVMQEYGVPSSWTKLYTITYWSLMYMYNHPSGVDTVEFIGCFKNDEILLRDRWNVLSYDSKHQTVRKTEINDLNGGGIVKYSESLVSLNTITKKKSMTKKRNRSALKHKKAEIIAGVEASRWDKELKQEIHLS